MQDKAKHEQLINCGDCKPNKRLFHVLQRSIQGARITLYPDATPELLPCSERNRAVTM